MAYKNKTNDRAIDGSTARAADGVTCRMLFSGIFWGFSFHIPIAKRVNTAATTVIAVFG